MQPAPEPTVPPKLAQSEPVRSREVKSDKEKDAASEVEPLYDKEFADEIDKKIEKKIRAKKAPSKPKPRPRSAPAVVIKKKVRKGRKKKETPSEPESVQKRILKLLVEAGDTGYALDDLSDLLGIVGPRLEPYLDVLKDQSYINIAVEVGRPPEYTIAAKGEQYLVETKPP
jgi:hypothetical protein